MIYALKNPWTLFTGLTLGLLALFVMTGCGAARSATDHRTHASNPPAQVSPDTGDISDDETAEPPIKEEAEPTNTKHAIRSDKAGKPDTGNKLSNEESSKLPNPQQALPDKAKSESLEPASARQALDQYAGGVDDTDSASAVDDDIWRLFELAEEYQVMGVIANREASWEEAQYYFEKCLKILATLDIDETDTTMTPESVKYTTVLENVVSDYRITLRSLGRLEKDAAPSVLLERFGDLEDHLNADTMSVSLGEFAEVTYDLPVVMNDRVRKSIVYFQTVAHDAFARYLSRSRRYNDMFKEILAEHDMPLDFVYLSLVESGYNPNAYSWARAMGLWQFISSTGRMYGLNRDWWIDERKDPVKATHAAARFLKDLYDQFGHWELAMAAYNGGPGRVSKTIKRQGTRDFWKMQLRRQTMDYVPLIYAAATIAKNPEKYGFFDIELEDPVVWEEIEIDRCLDLKVVAKEIGCSLQEIKDINPELLRNYTPPNAKKYALKLPVGKKEKFLAAYDNMPSPKETSWVKHEIRRGETVSTIAAKYGVSQYAILNANNLSHKSKIYAGNKLIVPVPMDRDYSSNEKRTYEADGSIYSVRAGDTMWDIARAFGTSVDAIRRINYTERGSRIYVGQKLKIPTDATKLKPKAKPKPVYASASKETSKSALPKSESRSGSKTYKVTAGDTLWDIARMFGTTTSNLRRINDLGRSSRIYPGQVLTVTGNTPDYVLYSVRRGDTLSKIASKHQTSISRILRVNGLTDPDNINVGDKLKIQSK